jgi:hypothetical protein
VFPATHRGHYTIYQNKVNGSNTTYYSQNYAFDPESRLNTEFNYVNLPGLNSLQSSYIISYDPTNKILQAVIGGYYFEFYNLDLSDLVIGSGATAKTKDLFILLSETSIAETLEVAVAAATDSRRTTKVLSS